MVRILDHDPGFVGHLAPAIVQVVIPERDYAIFVDDELPFLKGSQLRFAEFSVGLGFLFRPPIGISLFHQRVDQAKYPLLALIVVFAARFTQDRAAQLGHPGDQALLRR